MSMRDSHTSSAVTVVVPVYNRLKYLGATIDSVLRQTFHRWQLIVVDDGSQQDVAAFVARYPDSRIRVIRQASKGNAAARNAGIAASNQEFVTCLDSDDVWTPRFLETSLDTLRRHSDVHVVYTVSDCIDAQGNPIGHRIPSEPKNGSLLQPLLMGYPILPSSALARRSCFERWGGYTPGLDDWELWLRWAAQGCRFVYIEEPLVHYRIHDQNLNLDWARRRDAHFRMLDAFYQRESLPPLALRRREQAYANQHLRFAVLAWQAGLPEDGIADFVQAVLQHPAYLTDIDCYTQIACAHRGRIYGRTARELDLQNATETLDRCLDGLLATADLPVSIGQLESQASAWAYLALARLAYAVAEDMTAARRFLLRSLVASPAIAWRTDWFLWFVRTLVGFDHIRDSKAKLRAFRSTVCPPSP